VTIRLALAFSFVAAMSAAQADIAWKGTISEGEKSQFALTDTATGVSKWVKLGGVFESYSISQYDDQRQVLTLTKGGSTLTLSMATSQYTPPPAPAAATDDLRTMPAFRLAQALADRGDTQMQALMSELRDYQLNKGEVSRTIATGERKIRANAPDAPSPVALKSYREDLERWNREIARVDGEIRAAVEAKRRALPSGQ
jgi:hypothetical protein